MKKIYSITLCLFIALASLAQTSDNPFAIQAGLTLNNHNSSLKRQVLDYTKTGVGLETGLRFYLSPKFNLTANLGFFKIEEGDNVSSSSNDVDFSLEYKILPEESKLQPYLTAGAGFYSGTDNFGILPLGGGLRYEFVENLSAYVQARYKLHPTDENFDYLTTSIGLVYALGGNKDSDEDGVYDKDDECPFKAGGVATNGCPDTDGDGIADKDDNCPELAGILAFNGCPDTDGDGIMDLEDACPEEAGSEAMKGCPDTDGDGIADKDDKCPDAAGTKENSGCPDSDGDGIVDKDDKCPNEAGPKSNNGCKEADTDGDGILDKNDSCPDQAGVAANNGCPEIEEEVKEILLEALEGVQFKSGSDVLLASSYTKLDKVVEVMKSHSEFKLKISGYTDNTGSAATNLALSKKRAAAAKKYITDRGISESKISSEGYGIANPIADNGTSAGRAKNRRVEFEVSFQ